MSPTEHMSAEAWRRSEKLPPAGADRERPEKPRRHLELDLQMGSFAWLEALVWPEGGRPLYFHCPNERGNLLERVRMQRCGTRAGTPDWIFALPGGRSLWIELKVEAYPSREQKAVRDELEALGHDWRLCRSIDEMAAAMRAAGLTWTETPRAAGIRRAFS